MIVIYCRYSETKPSRLFYFILLYFTLFQEHVQIIVGIHWIPYLWTLGSYSVPCNLGPVLPGCLFIEKEVIALGLWRKSYNLMNYRNENCHCNRKEKQKTIEESTAIYLLYFHHIDCKKTLLLPPHSPQTLPLTHKHTHIYPMVLFGCH